MNCLLCEDIMQAIIFILIGTAVGWQLTGYFIGTNQKSEENLNLIWVRLMSSFGIGVMLETWVVYLIGYFLSVRAHSADSLGRAELCAMAAGMAFIILTFLRPIIRNVKAGSESAATVSAAAQRQDLKAGSTPEKEGSTIARKHFSGLIRNTDLFKREAVFYLALLVFVTLTFRYVLHAKGDHLYMGYTVFSDYAPNLALIRSFSWFENFPTQYPFFAGEDIKYHFMFMFFCGNLERMGLPIEVAYNLPSILGLFGFLVMLTQFALRVTGRFAAAIITPFLFVFRSGLALFYFIAEHLSAGDLIDAFRENSVFIGYTPNENWGLWNYNVYLNQRHLGFGLLIVMAVIWYYYGYLENACGGYESSKSGKLTDTTVNQTSQEEDQENREDKRESQEEDQKNREADQDRLGHDTAGSLSAYIKELFFTWDAWAVRDLPRVILTAAVLGMLSFWNGACVIGGLLVLAGFALFSKNKLDFLGLAIITVILSFLQTHFFISGSAVSPAFYWGFISESKTVMGVLWFLIEITGMTIAGAVFALYVLEGKYRALICAFLLPTAFAFTMSLTPDVTVNHKYIMMSMAFLAVIWAELLVRLWREEGSAAARIFAVVLAVILMATGAYDFVIIVRNNGKDHEFAVNTESELGHFIRDNLTWDDMVLSGPDSVSDFTVSGCRMYCGWPYYAWSAGYDTDYRFEMAKYIYTIDDEDELRWILSEERINYVLYENGMYYDDVAAREDVIADALTLVFESGDGHYRMYYVDEES